MRTEADWQTLQPACGETLRGKTSFAAIRLKTDEKAIGIISLEGTAGGAIHSETHQIHVHTLIARRMQGEEIDNILKHDFKFTEVISHTKKMHASL